MCTSGGSSATKRAARCNCQNIPQGSAGLCGPVCAPAHVRWNVSVGTLERWNVRGGLTSAGSCKTDRSRESSFAHSPLPLALSHVELPAFKYCNHTAWTSPRLTECLAPKAPPLRTAPVSIHTYPDQRVFRAPSSSARQRSRTIPTAQSFATSCGISRALMEDKLIGSKGTHPTGTSSTRRSSFIDMCQDASRRIESQKNEGKRRCERYCAAGGRGRLVRGGTW